MPVTIYGKAGCPYTADAREAFAKKGAVDYRDVKKDKAQLAEMLRLNGGDRRVPTIVEDGKVSIGYGGY